MKTPKLPPPMEFGDDLENDGFGFSLVMILMFLAFVFGMVIANIV